MIFCDNVVYYMIICDKINVMEVVYVDGQYITTRELCKWLKISPNTANNWRRKGMPYVEIGKTIRYKVEDVEKWLDEQKRKT